MFDAYKVAVHLTLVNGVSAGLGLINAELSRMSKHVGGVQNSFTALHAEMSKIKKLGLIGGGVAAAGAGMLSMFKGPIHEAKELQNQISNLNILGMKQAEISEVISKAWKTSRDVVTTTAAENIKTYRELRSAFGAGHEHEALGILGNVQRVGGILQAVTGKKQEGVGFDMVKGLELTVKGALSEEVLNRRMGMMTKSIVGMGGTVDAHDFHMALKYSKSGAMSYSEDFLFKYLPTLIQEFKTGKHGGASSAGTALNAGYRMVVGQQISKESIQNWIDAGLIDQSRVAANPHHKGTSKLLAGAVAGAALYAENPEIWATQVGLPAVMRLMASKHITQDQAVQSLTKDGNKAFLLNSLMNKAAQFDRDKKMIEQADSIGAYEKLIKTNPQLADMALHSQWKNLQAQLGYQVLPDVIKGTMWLTEKIKGLTEWFGKNEGTAKKLMYGFAGLGAAMLVGGSLTVLVAGFRGLGLILGAGKLASSITGVSAGLSSLSSAAGIATLGASLTTIAAGLGALGLATYGMSKVLDAVGGDGIHDELNHPGQKFLRHGRGANNGVWVKDDSLPQDHAGMHFVRGGRGGGWVKDVTPPAASKTVQVTTQIHLDTRQIAQAVTTHQAKGLMKPQSGTGKFDGSMMPPFAASVR